MILSADRPSIRTPPAVDPTLVEATLARAVFEDDRHVITSRRLIDVLLAEGIGVYVHGGTVRDWLAGIEPRDVDLQVDVSIEALHAHLRAAFPDIDPARRPRPDGYVLVWGGGRSSGVDISLLRSYRDVDGDLHSTRFRPRRDLREDVLLKDFSINGFYFDCRRRAILDPLDCGVSDIEHKRLRIITHPDVLPTNYLLTLRAAFFLCRGYTLTPETREWIETHADRDILSMNERLWRWLPANVVGRGCDPAHFSAFIRRWLRAPEARQLFERALAATCVET